MQRTQSRQALDDIRNRRGRGGVGGVRRRINLEGTPATPATPQAVHRVRGRVRSTGRVDSTGRPDPRSTGRVDSTGRPDRGRGRFRNLRPSFNVNFGRIPEEEEAFPITPQAEAFPLTPVPDTERSVADDMRGDEKQSPVELPETQLYGPAPVSPRTPQQPIRMGQLDTPPYTGPGDEKSPEPQPVRIRPAMTPPGGPPRRELHLSSEQLIPKSAKPRAHLLIPKKPGVELLGIVNQLLVECGSTPYTWKRI